MSRDFSIFDSINICLLTVSFRTLGKQSTHKTRMNEWMWMVRTLERVERVRTFNQARASSAPSCLSLIKKEWRFSRDKSFGVFHWLVEIKKAIRPKLIRSFVRSSSVLSLPILSWNFNQNVLLFGSSCNQKINMMNVFCPCRHKTEKSVETCTMSQTNIAITNWVVSSTQSSWRVWWRLKCRRLELVRQQTYC